MNRLKLLDEIEAVDLTLHLPSHQTLAIADVHLGYEADLIREGTLVPRRHFDDLTTRLARAFEHLGISGENRYTRIIVNGDLSHQFGYLTFRELEESSALLKFLRDYFIEVIVLEGNHDGDLKPLHNHDQQVYVAGSYKLGDTFFLHGDEVPDEFDAEIKTLVIGHEHPAIGLRDRVTGRVEQYKCFIKGHFQERDLLVLPSINPLHQGTDLTRERTLSPFLDEKEINQFSVFPVSDEGNCYRFGLLGDLVEGEDLTGGGFVQNRDSGC